MIVFCKMDPEAKGARGLGAVYVKKDAPGVSFGPAETLMGFRGVPSADIYFEDVKIAPEDVLLPAVSTLRQADSYNDALRDESWTPLLCLRGYASVDLTRWRIPTNRFCICVP